MHCEYCSKSVIENQHIHGSPVTVPGVGIAHRSCAQNAKFNLRTFKSLSLNALTDHEVFELKELLLQEVNARSGLASECE